MNDEREPSGAQASRQLVDWFASQLPDATDVRIDGLQAIEVGHSAEMLAFTLAWRSGSGQRSIDVVVRLRPPPPGLLEPYDMERQFQILAALENTPVRVPRALWLEPTGAVVGRELFVMERADGVVYERRVPDELVGAPHRVRRMCESMVDQVAAIHSVDLRATGLHVIGDGHDHLTRELDRWYGEMNRVKRGPLPQLERLHEELRRRQPDQCPAITLVHGDPKPGNFAFVGDEVNAVFDWEMSSIGDPLADIGWLEMNWALANPLPKLPGALTLDEAVARWSELTGIQAVHREWYRAFQGFKCVVIMLVGTMHFDAGIVDELRIGAMGDFIPGFTAHMLRELGIDGDIEPGPVTARDERLEAVKAEARP